MDYVSHVEELVDPLLRKERPNWGYVEKFTFVEALIKHFNYLDTVQDYDLLDQAKRMLK